MEPRTAAPAAPPAPWAGRAEAESPCVAGAGVGVLPASLRSEQSGRPVLPTGMRRLAVLVNRESGVLAERWSDEFAGQLLQPFREAGDEVTLRAGAGAEMAGLLEEALAEEPDALLVAGGDGSVNGTARRLRGSQVALGILPCGTLNIAARDLGIPLDPLEAAGALARAEVRAVDLLEVGGQVSLCGVIFGVFPQLHREDDEIHGSIWSKLGQVAWMLGEVTRGRELPRLGVRVLEAGGDEPGREELEPEPAQGVVVVSGSYRDGPGYLPLRVDPAEGTATAYRFRHRQTGELAAGVLTWLRGNWEQDPQLDLLRGLAFEVGEEGRERLEVLVDGEDMTLPNPVAVRLLPDALKVLVPRGSEEDAGRAAADRTKPEHD